MLFDSFRDPQSEKKLTGGANWTPQVAPTSWSTPGAPMVRTAWTADTLPSLERPLVCKLSVMLCFDL